jgi:hypothetical protein
MTKEEIINIAWNIFPISDREKNEAFIELLVHFAQAIAEKEREECADLLMGLHEAQSNNGNHNHYHFASNAIKELRGQE